MHAALERGDVSTLQIVVVCADSQCLAALTRTLSDLPGVRVVGSATSGKAALERVAELKPDIALLDVELPDDGGIAALHQMLQYHPQTSAVMVCPVKPLAVEKTMKALEAGAFDFVSKPSDCGESVQQDKLKADLRRVVQAFFTHQSVSALSHAHRPQTPAAPAVHSVSPRQAPPSAIDVVAIGVSTGGPNALGEMVPNLPGDLSVPVLIVQHMPSAFTALLATMLNTKSALRVVEGHNGERVESGTAYIAPGGLHMRVRRHAGGVVLETTLDPPEHHCRPSVDYLFRSVADVYGPEALGVIMTGMGSDGSKGLAAMKARGSYVLAQNEASSIVFGMPGEAVKAGLADEQVPLDKMASRIARLVGGR